MTTIKIGGNNCWSSFDETVSSIDAWYDKHTRLWCIQRLNKDGFQVGDAEWIYGKRAATERTIELKTEYNLKGGVI